MKRKVTWEIGDKNFEQITYSRQQLNTLTSCLGKLRDKKVIEEWLVEEIK